MVAGRGGADPPPPALPPETGFPRSWSRSSPRAWAAANALATVANSFANAKAGIDLHEGVSEIQVWGRLSVLLSAAWAKEWPGGVPKPTMPPLLDRAPQSEGGHAFCESLRSTSLSWAAILAIVPAGDSAAPQMRLGWSW